MKNREGVRGKSNNRGTARASVAADDPEIDRLGAARRRNDLLAQNTNILKSRVHYTSPESGNRKEMARQNLS